MGERNERRRAGGGKKEEKKGRKKGRGGVLGVLLFAQTIAPLRHFVPGETVPRAMYTLLTHTDQLFPSAEH